MTPQQVQRFFKVQTQAALARVLRRPASTVAEWFQRGCVPKAAQFELQIITGGRLRASNGKRR